MISILIPVFNFNVQSLVQELSSQLKLLQVAGEIIVYDDASDSSYKEENRSVSLLENVSYKELEQNRGRVVIRRMLAENANYNWLLFIDSDSAIINKNYLKKYLQFLTVNDDVVFTGGRVYQDEPPQDCSKRLHWKYGRERESAKGSATALHTNNFCIGKELFRQLNFPEQFYGYGHEDTWMQMELEQRGKKIVFINNPVLHTGLESANVYLKKSKNALKNLLLLVDIFGEKAVRKQVRLYNWFYWLRKLGLDVLVKKYVKKRIEKIEENLQSCDPSLRFFDLYRLFSLIKEVEYTGELR